MSWERGHTLDGLGAAKRRDTGNVVKECASVRDRRSGRRRKESKAEGVERWKDVGILGAVGWEMARGGSEVEDEKADDQEATGGPPLFMTTGGSRPRRSSGGAPPEGRGCVSYVCCRGPIRSRHRGSVCSSPPGEVAVQPLRAPLDPVTLACHASGRRARDAVS